MSGFTTEKVDVLRETRVRDGAGGLSTTLTTVYSQVTAYVVFPRVRSEKVSRLEEAHVAGPIVSGPGVLTHKHRVVEFRGADATKDVRETDHILFSNGSYGLVLGVRSYPDAMPSQSSLQLNVELHS